jgi:Family of unknown function (DUF6318)
MRIRVGPPPAPPALLACAAALTLLTACTHQDPYATLPPTPTASTATPTPTPPSTPRPPEPTLPAHANDDTPTAAQSFARFWLTALDYAYQTGDTKPFRALGACKGCTALADSIDTIYGKGGHIEGGRIDVVSSQLVRFVAGKAALVRADYSQTDGTTVFPDGHKESVHKATSLAFLFTLKRAIPTWQVTAVQPIKES